ncbi:MAG: heparinase II/III family protein [Velocimicrobium sp.]
MFYEIANNYSHPFQKFNPFSSITNRSFWNLLDLTWQKQTLQLGETYVGFSYPYLSALDYMEFSRTGNRANYETKFFSKRHALNALILAECVENKGRFLDDIVNGIFSICDESSWCLPPHNSYIRDTLQLPLPDTSAPVLDLFACETASVLATAYYLLKDVLDDISPFITKRIQYELKHRIFTPYDTTFFWWMGDGRQPMNNWTIWCTQNILLSVFLASEDTNFKHRVFLNACKSTDYFLSEYGEDGCCDEGAQYYRHAGLCLFNVIEICNAITGGCFADLYRLPKIKNIASYIWNAHITDKYYINFADCAPIAGRCSAREYLFAKQTENEDMMRFAAADFKAGGFNSYLLPSENNLYYRLQHASTVSEIMSYDTSLPIHHADIYYPSVGLFSVRDCVFYLGVKAGDNADSHNHNDTGSFTIYKNGKPMFIDIGVESYTKKTFSPTRYEIWTMQSAYHNLPTINGYMQKDGEEYRAQHVHYQICDTFCEIEMDLTAAYPKESGILSYHRHVTLEKGSKIVIHDHYSLLNESRKRTTAPPVILSLMTYEKPELQSESSKLSIGNLGTLFISGGSVLSIEEIKITDPRLLLTWQHAVYRILIGSEKENVILRVS